MMPKMTQKEHETAINAFIPMAEVEATNRVKKLGKQYEVRKGCDGVNYRWSFFSQFFNEAMNRLTSKAGLRVLAK